MKIIKSFDFSEDWVKQYISESNAIEGIFSSEAVESSFEAWEYISNFTSLGMRHVLDLHLVMSGTKDDPRKFINDYCEPGVVRDYDVFVGGRKCTAPMIAKMKLREWAEIFCEREKPMTTDDCVRAHVLFEKIHPFGDGNGRVGRLLLLWHYKQAGCEVKMFTNYDKHEDYYPLFK